MPITYCTTCTAQRLQNQSFHSRLTLSLFFLLFFLFFSFFLFTPHEDHTGTACLPRSWPCLLFLRPHPHPLCVSGLRAAVPEPPAFLSSAICRNCTILGRNIVVFLSAVACQSAVAETYHTIQYTLAPQQVVAVTHQATRESSVPGTVFRPSTAYTSPFRRIGLLRLLSPTLYTLATPSQLHSG